MLDVGLVGFLELAPHDDPDGGAEGGDEDEVRAPSEPAVQVRPQDRRERRRYRQHEADVTEDLGRPFTVVKIAHHGAADDRSGARAHRLEQAGHNEFVDRARERARGAGRDIEDEAGRTATGGGHSGRTADRKSVG